jgi:sugar phosphate isomerase/epimerase
LVWKSVFQHLRIKGYVGVVSAEVLSDYAKTDWGEYRDALLKK